MPGKKQLVINLIANTLAFSISFGISFFLTPFIIKTVGSVAYGFVSLALDFLSYASLITIALNSMAGRFITIKIHQNDNEGANKYFNSVLVSNSIMSAALAIPAFLCIVFLNKLVNVPPEIYTDVQILIAFLFLNFVLSIMGTTFSVATFARNRLELSSLRSIEFNIIRAIMLVSLFTFLRPSVSYIGITACVASTFVLITNVYYTKTLLPEVRIDKKYFDFKAVLELITSGVWNTIVRLGQLLLDGFDLLITNIFIGATAMGTLAIAKTVPMFITSVVGMLAGVFMPQFTIIYAKNDMPSLISNIKKSMKIMGIIVGIPVSLLIAYGDVFYHLWVPSQDAKLLQILSIISVASIIISGSINSIYNIFTVTNKLKANALWLVGSGLINILIVVILLKTTLLGLYAIAGISTIISIVRNLVFTAPYGAKCLNLRWPTFYDEILKSIVAVFIVTAIALSLRLLLNIDSWATLILFGGISAIIGLILNMFFILNKEERNYLVQASLKIVRREK